MKGQRKIISLGLIGCTVDPKLTRFRGVVTLGVHGELANVQAQVGSRTQEFIDQERNHNVK